MKIEKPFDTFEIEKHAGEYKDFGGKDNGYPLPGVTFPVDYGDIEGYTGEDGAKLDLFVGSGELCGFIKVSRLELEKGEHKFFINLTEDEEKAVLDTFALVLLDHGRFGSVEEMVQTMEPFRNK